MTRTWTSPAVERTVGAADAAALRDLTLAVYRRAEGIARDRGIILADTKLEFGRSDGTGILLADEVLTPDSSRFWPADRWQPGRAQPSYDKQFVRDWLTSPASGWDRAGQHRAAAAARRDRRAHPGALRAGLRAADRSPLALTPSPARARCTGRCQTCESFRRIPPQPRSQPPHVAESGTSLSGTSDPPPPGEPGGGGSGRFGRYRPSSARWGRAWRATALASAASTALMAASAAALQSSRVWAASAARTPGRAPDDIDSVFTPRPTSTQASAGSAAASPQTPVGMPLACRPRWSPRPGRGWPAARRPGAAPPIRSGDQRRTCTA